MSHTYTARNILHSDTTALAPVYPQLLYREDSKVTSCFHVHLKAFPSILRERRGFILEKQQLLIM